MKSAFTAWGWGLRVVARSPLPVLALAAVAGLWGLAAYQWLWIPESSLLMLATTLVWAILLVVAGIVLLAGTAAGAAQAVSARDQRLSLRAFWKLGGRDFALTLLLVLAGLALVVLLAGIFGWVNRHSIEVASFLTFHSAKPVSHVVIEKIYGVIEALIWIATAGLLLNSLISLLSVGWGETRKQWKAILASCCYKRAFLASLVNVVVFGGVAGRIAIWHPDMPVGFWDYAQTATRFGVVLILLVAGWLAWILSLARLSRPSPKEPAS
jgi:hypothetical protein